MNRRDALGALAASGFAGMNAAEQPTSSVVLELTTWFLHNTRENQSVRLSGYLQNGLAPGLSRAGARLAGVFGNVIGGDGPYYVTLAEYPSLTAMDSVLEKLSNDHAYAGELERLDQPGGLPFVRVESSLLRSFGIRPETSRSANDKAPSRIFELRRYESQTFITLQRKVGMFLNGEMGVFQRLGMRPVFFGQTFVGPAQPNLMYMLSYDDLAARDRLWREFGSDPEWRKIRSAPELQDSEIVSNITNVILRALPFSGIR